MFGLNGSENGLLAIFEYGCVEQVLRLDLRNDAEKGRQLWECE